MCLCLVFADHTDKYHFTMSFFCSLYSLPDGSEGSVQPGSTLTNSTWGCLSKKSSLHTTASEHISPSDKHTQSYTRFTSYTASPPYSSNSHMYRLIQNYQLLHGGLGNPMFADCWTNLQSTEKHTGHTHTHCHAHATKNNKSDLLIFASDNRSSQSRERSKRLRTPVVKLTRNHNATPCVFWRSNMIGSVARGRSSVLIYWNQSYRWMFSLDLFSNTLVPLNIPIWCKIHFARNKQSR